VNRWIASNEEIVGNDVVPATADHRRAPSSIENIPLIVVPQKQSSGRPPLRR
jgi:hypothetical protein